MIVCYTLGGVNKGRLKPAHLPPQTSNKLLQNSSRTPWDFGCSMFVSSRKLFRFVAVPKSPDDRDALTSFCRLRFPALDARLPRRAGVLDHVSSHYHQPSISARHRSHSKYARSHNSRRRLWSKTIRLCVPMS